MNLTNKNPFDNNISSRKLNEDLPFDFDRGWSPVLVPVLDDNAVYLKIKDWIGGEGDKPFDCTIATYYLGETGFVTDIEDAVNIAEDFLTTTHLEDIIDIDTLLITLERRELGSTNVDLKMQFDTKDGSSHTITGLTFTDVIITDSERLDISKVYGVTRRALSETLYTLKQWIIINDYTTGTPDYSEEQALSHKAVMEAIDEARAKFDVPIIDLTTTHINTIEGDDSITTENPYYAVVSEDNRTGGIHSDTCSVTCVNVCCETNTDGGYEERGNRDGITGCLCEPEVEEVNAVCDAVVTGLGNPGDTYSLQLDLGEGWVTLTLYVQQIRDTIEDVRDGLIANIASPCDEPSVCSHTAIGTDTITFEANEGLGSTPNSWGKQSLVTGGVGSMTFIQTVNGVDYVPPTYRGVRHHVIAYDGSDWHDFGTVLSFGNNGYNSCICTFISQTDTPDDYVDQAGKVPIVNSTEDALEFINYTFLNLNDVSNTDYSGSQDLVPAVNSAENALELIDVQTLVHNTFLELDDVNDSTYTGTDNYIPVVNESEERLELTNVNIPETFLDLSDTPSAYPDPVSHSSHPLSITHELIMNNSGDSLEFVRKAWRQGYDGELATNNFVTLAENDYIARPQHFQFVDDSTDTSLWGADEVGRMRMVIDTNTEGDINKLQVWAKGPEVDAPGDSGTYDWQDLYNYTASTPT